MHNFKWSLATGLATGLAKSQSKLFSMWPNILFKCCKLYNIATRKIFTQLTQTTYSDWGPS